MTRTTIILSRNNSEKAKKPSGLLTDDRRRKKGGSALAGNIPIGRIRRDKPKRRFLVFGLLVVLTASSATPRPWDYNSLLTRKMPLFFEIYHQTALLAVGDSRCVYNVNPRHFDFFTKPNGTHPQAFNLAVNSADLETAYLMVERYGYHCPKLEWIIINISPRMFNQRWSSTKRQAVTGSPGYKYDQSNSSLIWNKDGKPVGLPERPDCCAGINWWGYDSEIPDNNASDWRADFRESNRSRIRGLVQNVNFAFASDRMRQFKKMVESLSARGVSVCAFTPPIHYFCADQPAVDDEGTSRAGYDRIVSELTKLEDNRKYFIFMDIDKKGHSGFASDEYYNFDHLNTKGARRLTKMINARIREHLELGTDSSSGNVLIQSIDYVSTGNNYIASFLRKGEYLYADRSGTSFRITEIPPSLSDAEMIRTANDDDYVSAERHLEFTVSDTCDVFIAWHRTMKKLPSWASVFGPESGRIASDSLRTYALFKKTYPSGRITLGGNDRNATGSVGNYLVIVRKPAAPIEQPHDSILLLGSLPSSVSAGDILDLRWKTEGEMINGVVIKISKDRGRTWHPITGSAINRGTAAWGRYSWEVPDSVDGIPIGGECLLFSFEDYDRRYRTKTDRCITITAGATSLRVPTASTMGNRPADRFALTYDLRGRRIGLRSYKRHSTGNYNGIFIMQSRDDANIRTGVRMNAGMR